MRKESLITFLTNGHPASSLNARRVEGLEKEIFLLHLTKSWSCPPGNRQNAICH